MTLTRKVTSHGLVLPTTLADISELEANIRPEDRREAEEVGLCPVLHSIAACAFESRPCYTIKSLSGQLGGILGAIPDGRGGGMVWMLGTTLIERHSIAFLRGSREVLADLHARYPLLYNRADARNEVHLKWLRWLGFSFINLIPEYGPYKVPLIEFARCALPQQPHS